MGAIIHHKHNTNGQPNGNENAKPIIDTCIFEVKFQDGHVEEYVDIIVLQNTTSMPRLLRMVITAYCFRIL
jgi:hypothetical protein